MTDTYFESVEQIIQANPLMISHNIQINHTSSSTAYLKGELLFTDGTWLAVFLHVRTDETGPAITDYRYHYMTDEKQLIFRYDNAPHHTEISTFPNHKHLPSGVYASDMPDFKDVMNEITEIIIEKMI